LEKEAEAEAEEKSGAASLKRFARQIGKTTKGRKGQMEKQIGNLVTYDAIPIRIRRGRRELIGLACALGAAFVCAIVGLVLVGLGFHSASLMAWIVAAGMGLVGANTVTYDANGTIPSGTTAPTAAQAFGANQISAVITGDATATTFTVTHNWGLTTAQLTAAQPNVTFEPLLAAFYSQGVAGTNGANPFIASRTTNTVVFTCLAFTGAAFRVVLKRPFSPDM
jgi:hypothetical protein